MIETVSIESINIKIGETKLTLTKDEASQLYKALGELFEKTTNIVWQTPATPSWPYPIITCASGSGGNVLTGSTTL